MSVLKSSYRPLEIVIVDNGSSDGSYEYIKSLMKVRPKDLKVKLIKLSKNLGFAVANNLAFKKIDSESKYIALINNDLAIEEDSIEKLVNFIENNPDVAGVQGRILTWDCNKIDSAYNYVTQFYNIIPIFRGLPINACQKTKFVSYVDGAFSIYRVEAVKRSGGLFRPYFFMWGDDYELGIRLWRKGYKLVYVPITVGRHYRSATVDKQTKKMHLDYWKTCANSAIIVMYDRLWIVNFLFRFILSILYGVIYRNKDYLRGVIDGFRIGIKLRKSIKDLRSSTVKEPQLRLSIKSLLIILLKSLEGKA